MMRKSVTIPAFTAPALAAALLLSACAGGFAQLGAKSAAPPPVADAGPALDSAALQAPPPPVGATSAEALDTTTPEQRAAALAIPEPAGEQSLGNVTVALGNVTEAGFWLRSTLVTAARPGRVVTAGGQSVQVDLQPGTGAAQLSLAAFRALGLGLTDLPEVSVFAQ